MNYLSRTTANDPQGAQPSFRKDALMSQLGEPSPQQTMGMSGSMGRGGVESGQPKPAPPAMAPRKSLQDLSAAYQGAGAGAPPMGAMPGAGMSQMPQGRPMMQPGGMGGPELPMGGGLPPEILQLLLGSGGL